MDEQLLRRVADTRALRLRVDDDPLRRVQIGRGVYEHVAVPGGRVDHGYRRDALQRVLQALSAARDDEIHDAGLRGELGELLAPAARDEHDRARGHSRCLGGLRGDLREDRVRVLRRGRAAKHDRVPGLQAQRSRVDRDVWPRLVYHGDHTERHAHLLRGEPVGQPEPVDDLAHRVGQRRDRPHAVGHPPDPLGVEREAVQQRRRKPGRAPRVHVARVCVQDVGRPLLERVGDRVQRGVLRVTVERGEGTRRLAGGKAQLRDGLGDCCHARRVRGPTPDARALRRARSSRGARLPRSREA